MPDLMHGDGQDLLARYKAAWERRDVDAAVALFTDGAEYRIDPFDEPMRGANAIRAYWNEAAATEVNIEFDAERVWVSGRTVLASWHAAFTRRATAERVRVRGFMTLELADDGRVERLREWTATRTVGTDSTVGAEQREGVDGNR